MADTGEACATDDPSKEGDEKKHKLNETKTTKTSAIPHPKKPRTNKDDDGKDLLEPLTATVKVLSEPNFDLTNDPTAWSGTSLEQELTKHSRQKELHNMKQDDALDGLDCAFGSS